MERLILSATKFLSSLLQLGSPWLWKTVSVLPNCRDEFLGENFYWTMRYETSMLRKHKEEIGCMPRHSLRAARSGWGELFFISYQCVGGPQFFWSLTGTATDSRTELQ